MQANYEIRPTREGTQISALVLSLLFSGAPQFLPSPSASRELPRPTRLHHSRIKQAGVARHPPPSTASVGKALRLQAAPTPRNQSLEQQPLGSGGGRAGSHGNPAPTAPPSPQAQTIAHTGNSLLGGNAAPSTILITCVGKPQASLHGETCFLGRWLSPAPFASPQLAPRGKV